MCVGHRFKRYSHARDYLDEAKNAIIRRQYQKALNRLELAEKEIQEQKESLRKFVEKELEGKEDNFQDTPENIAELEKLNVHLRVIENEANVEVQKIKQALQARLREQEDFLTDYEIEIEVTFDLRKDDPEYSEDEDNILVTLYCSDYIGFDDVDENYDYNDVVRFLPFRHCALFHALYDHITPRLHRSNLLRIGTIWVEIEVKYQKKYGLESGELRRDNGIGSDESFHYKLKQ